MKSPIKSPIKSSIKSPIKSATVEDVYCLNNKQFNNIGCSIRKYSLNNKCYINPYTAICPICLMLINKYNNAYLTECGHAYHKTCIMTALEYSCKSLLHIRLNCSLCRKNLDVISIEESVQMFDINNVLDEVDNFWLTIQYNMRDICIASTKTNRHFYACDKMCKICNI